MGSYREKGGWVLRNFNIFIAGEMAKDLGIGRKLNLIIIEGIEGKKLSLEVVPGFHLGFNASGSSVYVGEPFNPYEVNGEVVWGDLRFMQREYFSKIGINYKDSEKIKAARDFVRNNQYVWRAVVGDNLYCYGLMGVGERFGEPYLYVNRYDEEWGNFNNEVSTVVAEDFFRTFDSGLGYRENRGWYRRMKREL